MVWPFSKKRKKEVKEIAKPELPELPELPPLPEGLETFAKPRPKARQEKKPGIKDELPALPSPPTTPTKIEKLPIPPKPPIRERKTREIEETKPRVREIKPEIKAEPIFVRIDRYQKSIANLQDIKKKLLEIENLLRDIREIRTKEEAQLENWQEEIQDAKSKLDNIDKTVFQKLEE